MYLSGEIFFKSICYWKIIETKLQKNLPFLRSTFQMDIYYHVILTVSHTLNSTFYIFTDLLCHLVPPEFRGASLRPRSGAEPWGTETETGDRHGSCLVGKAD